MLMCTEYILRCFALSLRTGAAPEDSKKCENIESGESAVQNVFQNVFQNENCTELSPPKLGFESLDCDLFLCTYLKQRKSSFLSMWTSLSLYCLLVYLISVVDTCHTGPIVCDNVL